MIIITIIEKEKGLIDDREQMTKIFNAINVEYQKSNLSRKLFTNYGVATSSNKIEISFTGITGSDEVLLYIVRTFAEIIKAACIDDVCYVSNSTNVPQSGDLNFQIKEFEPANTRNSELLDGLVKDDEIPERYLCALSNQIMDEPVFTKHKPDTFYNKSHLIFWLYSKGNMKDIYAQVPFKVSDIIPDDNLRNEISQYTKEKFAQSLRDKQAREKQALIDIIKKYTTEDNVTQVNIDKSFRNAAAFDNLEDLKIIYKKISNINAQDDNPQRKKTALHWAIQKGNIKIMEFLLGHNAKTNIPDAKGKTALDYANSSTNPDVRQRMLLESDVVNLSVSMSK